MSKVTLGIYEEVTVPIAVEVFPKGLTVHKIQLDTDGTPHDILEGPFSDDDVPYKYVNTVIGRYANRVPVSAEGHPIEKGGYKGVVHPVANEGSKTSLHGGPDTLDSALWEHITNITDQDNGAKLFSTEEIKSITSLDSDKEPQVQKHYPSYAIFKATSPSGHNGFPGTLDLEVLFAVLPRAVTPDPSATQYQLGQILVVYRAKLQEPGLVSPVNLTQHWGFNLEASIRKAPHLNVRDHYATINAPNTIAVDSAFLPTGELIPTAGTPHQHNGKKIGDQFPEGGYDHFYLFSKENYDSVTKAQTASIPLEGGKLGSINLVGELLDRSPPSAPQVELWSEKTGFKLQFTSNQSGVQFYTANYQSGAGTRKAIHGGSADGDGYPKEGAAFLEFHNPLAAFLHPQNGIDTLLTSDEVYHNYVKVNVDFTKPSRQDA